MDNLYKVISLNDEVKVYLVKSTDITNEAIRRHDIWPSAASLLGKTMTIGLMMGATLKYDCACTIKLDGNGPVGTVCVDADSYGNVRGFVQNNHVNFTRKNKLDEITTLGVNGFIDVIKDLKMEDKFTSSININTGDLAKDFTYYFAKSEQTPSAILLGSKFDVDNTCTVCGGMLIQLLPNASENTISYLENILPTLPDFSELLINNSFEEILNMVFGDNYKILDKVNVKFHCGCSKDRFCNGILTLPMNEIDDMINDDKDIIVTCQYCGNEYTFNKEDLQKLKEIKKDLKENE